MWVRRYQLRNAHTLLRVIGFGHAANEKWTAVRQILLLKRLLKNPFTVKFFLTVRRPNPRKRAPKNVFVLYRFALPQITKFRKIENRKNPCDENRRWSYSDIILGSVLWLDLKWAGKLGSVSWLAKKINKTKWNPFFCSSPSSFSLIVDSPVHWSVYHLGDPKLQI